MKIKIEDIRKEVEKHDWRLISTEYKNLESEMIFECPEKHKVYAPYKKIRDRYICPTCEDNPLKNIDLKIIPKSKDTTRFLVFDQSTKISGWAIYDDKTPIKYGVYETTFTEEDERLDGMRQWLASLIYTWNPDIVVFEDIYLNQKRGSDSNDGETINSVTMFKILAHLQGILINYCYRKKVKYFLAHSATWRKYCNIRGATRPDKKKSAQLMVKKWYGINVPIDAAEALCIGKYMSETYMDDNAIIEWE